MNHLTTDKLLSLGMALHADKRTMETRVRSIFARKKSAWFASLAAVVLCGVIGVLGFTTACQPVEETIPAAVIEANLHKAETKQETQTTAVEKKSAAKLFGTPEGHYVFSAIGADGRIAVDANAVIVTPETDALPIARVAWRSFTEQDVENAYETLLSGSTPVEEDGAWPKFYYQRILDGLLEQKRLGRLDKYETMGDLDDAIREVEAQVAAAPEDATPIVPNMSIENGRARVLALWDNNDASDLMVQNLLDDGHGKEVHYIRDMFDKTEFQYHDVVGSSTVAYTPMATLHVTPVPPQVSEQEALETAKQVVSGLGLIDFTYAGSRLAPLYETLGSTKNISCSSAYEFLFTRSVQGVNVTFTNDYHAVLSRAYNADTVPWMYERIRVFVDDDGVYACIWAGPCLVTEIVNEKADLLPFEQVASIFEEGIVQTFADRLSDTVKNIEVHISRVQLGLMRVTEEDSNDTGLLIPVWDFFGWYDEGHGYPMGTDGYESLLTINAMDGSIIDRKLGY